MEEPTQGIDINDVALENIVQIDPSQGAPTPMPGYEAPPAPAPELPTNNETTPAEPQTPDQMATEQPGTEEPAQEQTPGTGTMDDPIKIDTTQQQEPGEEPIAQDPIPAEDDWNQEEQEEIFNEHLADYTQNQIQSIQDINNLIAENERLKNQPQQPEFTSESAKQLFEFAQNSANPLAMGRNYLQAVALDVPSLNDKQKLFEAYVLDEQNSDLTREQAVEYFNEEYEQKYGDAEESLMQKRQLTLDVRAAETKIKSIQEQALSAQTKDSETAPSEGPTPEQLDEIHGSIDQSLEQMAAISIPAGDDNAFNFEVSSEDDLEAFASASKDPMSWLQGQINSFQQSNGTFDYDGYNAFIGSLLFSSQIAEGIFKHGQNNGTKQVVENLQNPVKPGSDTPQMPGKDNRSIDDKIWDGLANKMHETGF